MRSTSLSIARGNTVRTCFRRLDAQIHASILPVSSSRFNLAYLAKVGRSLPGHPNGFLRRHFKLFTNVGRCKRGRSCIRHCLISTLPRCAKMRQPTPNPKNLHFVDYPISGGKPGFCGRYVTSSRCLCCTVSSRTSLPNSVVLIARKYLGCPFA
jgi:hypothetical protein